MKRNDMVTGNYSAPSARKEEDMRHTIRLTVLSIILTMITILRAGPASASEQIQVQPPNRYGHNSFYYGDLCHSPYIATYQVSTEILGNWWNGNFYVRELRFWNGTYGEAWVQSVRLRDGGAHGYVRDYYPGAVAPRSLKIVPVNWQLESRDVVAYVWHWYQGRPCGDNYSPMTLKVDG